jgi:GNAT superfamily N-acetyltransferase
MPSGQPISVDNVDNEVTNANTAAYANTPGRGAGFAAAPPRQFAPEDSPAAVAQGQPLLPPWASESVHAESTVDIDDAVRRVDAKLAALDPLVPAYRRIEPGPEDELIAVELPGGTAVGIAHFDQADPQQLDAAYRTLRQHHLTLLTDGKRATAAAAAVLTRWERHLAEHADPADPETAALITLPSRDHAAVAALVAHHFTPSATLAVRTPGRQTTAPRDVQVRLAGVDDSDAIVELSLAVIEHDAMFGTAQIRHGTEEALRRAITEQLADGGLRVWLAEDDDNVHGMVSVEFPPQSAWIADQVAAAPAACLRFGYVSPRARGAGIGSALVAEAHHALDQAGISATLLHHVPTNSLATPFWYSHGYRPLWTTWQRRPTHPRR